MSRELQQTSRPDRDFRAGYIPGSGGRGFAKLPTDLPLPWLVELKTLGYGGGMALAVIGSFVQLRGDLTDKDGRRDRRSRGKLLCSDDTWKRSHRPALVRLALWAADPGRVPATAIGVQNLAGTDGRAFITLDRVRGSRGVRTARGTGHRAATLLGLLVCLVALVNTQGLIELSQPVQTVQ